MNLKIYGGVVMKYDNKFGMFIHWGIYALTGLQDQALQRFQMDHKEYDDLMHQFNPVKYDPEQWVLLAKEAGMKYICFTTKHHDGFCMWDTKYTDFKITNTPYGKDVLKMLAEACQKHGMLLSLYYSNPDWNHPYGFNPYTPFAKVWRLSCSHPDQQDTVIYRQYIKNQITELLTQYGPIYTLFWDIPPGIEDPSLNELVRKLQPNILINDRGWSKGDFGTPEREYDTINASYFESMTEACNSVDQQSWGFRTQPDFYSLRHLNCAIDRFMSMGASYLLNVGPSPEGEITEEYADRIRRIGNWYNRMEGCLEQAQPDPLNYQPRDCKCVATMKNGKTYLHFHDGIPSTAVSLENYPNTPQAVRLMNTNTQLPFALDLLPEFRGGMGVCDRKFLHIMDIPVDDLANEPIVLEITW